MNLSATYTAEIEIALTGSFVAAEPDVGLSAGIEDEDIEAIYFIRMRMIEGRMIPYQFDILAGLDRAAKTAVIQNVLDALGADRVSETLMEGME